MTEFNLKKVKRAKGALLKENNVLKEISNQKEISAKNFENQVVEGNFKISIINFRPQDWKQATESPPLRSRGKE